MTSLDTIGTRGVDTFEFVEIFSFSFKVNASRAVWTKEGQMFSSFERDPLLGAYFAAIFLDSLVKMG